MLMTRMRFQIREKSVTRSVSPTPKVIIIDDTENIPSLDHTTLFKMLMDLLDDEIKSAMEAQFAALQNKFTQKMEETLNQRMKVP